MNEQAPPLADETVKRAARLLEQHKFKVLEENWQSGRRRLAIVATPGGGILAGAEVRSAASPVPGGCLTALTAHRVSAVIRDLHAWSRQHDAGEFDEFWLVIVTLHPDGTVDGVSRDAVPGSTVPGPE
jgi:Holliday junction resolvase-like predicted endonuclease